MIYISIFICFTNGFGVDIFLSFFMVQGHHGGASKLPTVAFRLIIDILIRKYNINFLHFHKNKQKNISVQKKVVNFFGNRIAMPHISRTTTSCRGIDYFRRLFSIELTFFNKNYKTSAKNALMSN